ncbi:MAG: nucleotidyltransferase domain-containing protein [Thermoplasmatales archaeon]|jgi:hypothetical protein|nr:nucleotidyltransferase domain-containing protein [Candidatus Thermoplasmatota archaeon]MDA8054963.1 nucleotidyltransferase domain-containing protein [Thermoplasmatales archaeon]
MEIKAYINNEVGAQLRKRAIERFTYFKGSLSNAVEEAIVQWLRRNERIAERLKILLDKAFNDDDVIAIYLFGSYVEKKTDYRDIDIAFLLKDPAKEISVLSRYDDLEMDPRLDISCLNSLATMIQQEVLENGTIIMSKDNGALYDFSERIIREYSDFNWLYELMING